MRVTITEQICPPLLVRFVLESALEYAPVGDVDGRLACYARGEGRWAIAWFDRDVAGIACIVTLDDGPYQGYPCLYWLEVLPPFQRYGIGQALLAWVITQMAGQTLMIAATPPSASFYRRHLTGWSEPTPNTFLVKGGAVRERDERIAACGDRDRFLIIAGRTTTAVDEEPAQRERSIP